MARLVLSKLQETLATERLADGTKITYTAISPKHPKLSVLRAAVGLVDKVATSAPRDGAGSSHFDHLPGGTGFVALWTHPKTQIMRSPSPLPGDLVVVHANRTDIAVHDGALAQHSQWDIAAALCREMARAAGPIRPRKAARLRDWKPAEIPSLETTVEGLQRFFSEVYA